MIYFFTKSHNEFFVIDCTKEIQEDHLERFEWLLSGAKKKDDLALSGTFIGPRKEMITPWSTNAVEIFLNAGVDYIKRIELFKKVNEEESFDPMLKRKYSNVDQNVFTIDRTKEEVIQISDIAKYSEEEGLALSEEEVAYLEEVSKKIGRSLTDSEVFGFSQINSEHCRHKIFNGEFIIDDEVKKKTLFALIKETSKAHPNLIVSAYKDNVAFIEGPKAEQFAPTCQDRPDYFERKEFDSVLSLKAETHNFPTTVEPFNGAATGSGGEIRDRLAGGQGSIPLAGTAVYMTSYPRLDSSRQFEEHTEARPWLYQSPKDILIKASNGASDFGNKFGQPLIAGSILSFETKNHEEVIGFDKVIMLAGGIGFAKKSDSLKQPVTAGKKVVVMGGDNYRIGMGGGAVSSVNTGEFENAIELNAVQRSNPEMQKRVANVVRAMTELSNNPIISIHDHGAGGHLNCLSELVEETGGKIDIDKLPVGDETLSSKEVLSNESQERMGLVIGGDDLKYLEDVAKRERAPLYDVGSTTDDQQLVFDGEGDAFQLELDHLFGSSPKTVLTDKSTKRIFNALKPQNERIEEYLSAVLKLESVACKDWLTNKVDRCVTGKVALQQTIGEIQLPLNNLGVMALDYKNLHGVATSIGHSPISALVDAGAGSRLSITEALTNLVFAPLTHGLTGVSLSANWMWPAKKEGENARLYAAVEAMSEFSIALGINIPTGKDSLSMTQRYPDGKEVQSPGTVIISSVGETGDIRKVISPDLKYQASDSILIYIPFGKPGFSLGGSALSQVLGSPGTTVPDTNAAIVKSAFEVTQELIRSGSVLSGHDVGSGGLITTLLEMNFPNKEGGMEIDLRLFEAAASEILFSESPGVVLQLKDGFDSSTIDRLETKATIIGKPSVSRNLKINLGDHELSLDIDQLRDTWMQTSLLMDVEQSNQTVAKERFDNYRQHSLSYSYPANFQGTYKSLGLDPERTERSGVKAAIIREKGVNSDREMAYALFLAGFDVKDVHMTDLISGREDLSDVSMIVFVGGFSNSDVLGSAKGWAGSFLYNEKANKALKDFYNRKDTLSLGVCNGCQLMMELEVIYPSNQSHPKMLHNKTGKFECGFVGVTIHENNTVMLENMTGSQLGIWLAHGEGKFEIRGNETDFNIPVKYTYDQLPGNPNGSDFSAAALASDDGRHLAIMPHLERSLFPWNWAHYNDKTEHEVSPWMIPFKNAFNWIDGRKGK